MISTKLLQVFALSAAAMLAAPTFASKAESFANGKSWYGVPSSAEVATQVVDVKGAKAINVKCGETVSFRNGDKTFTWRFDVVNHRAVDLRKVAPAGFTTDQLMVYVSPNGFERN